MEALQLIRDDIPVSKYSAQAIAAIVEGEVNPLTAYLNMSKFAKVADAVLKNKEVKDLALNELEKYGSEQRTFGDCKAEIIEAGVKYDYSECNDPVYAEIIAQEAEILEKKKAREAYLKAIRDHETTVNESDGTINTLYPPIKRSTTTIKLTFKK